jgi:hypothetical protein
MIVAICHGMDGLDSGLEAMVNKYCFQINYVSFHSPNIRPTRALQDKLLTNRRCMAYYTHTAPTLLGSMPPNQAPPQLSVQVQATGVCGCCCCVSLFCPTVPFLFSSATTYFSHVDQLAGQKSTRRGMFQLFGPLLYFFPLHLRTPSFFLTEG